MRWRRFVRSAAILAAACGLATMLGAPDVRAAKVTVEGQSILVDGRPFPVRGAAGESRLAELKRLGGNTVRTYGGDPGAVLAEAERVGLKVIVGLWLEHPRRGFDYGDAAAAAAQLAAIEEVVRRYKAHPALLLWGVGNEVEAELADDAPVWPAIEAAAARVKRLDPDHPTMAVLQEAGGDKVRKLAAQAPSVEVLGVNSYGEAAASLPARVRAQGWRGPLLLSEIGPLGQWQAARTAWNAPLEPSTTEKARLMRRRLAEIAASPELAGAIVFYWGQKQEVTPTWHSLFLPEGAWTETLEAMAEAWGGETAGGNRAPRVRSLSFDEGGLQARLEAFDPDGDVVSVRWRLFAESTALGKAGDWEPVPPERSEAIRQADARGCRIEGLSPGAYRLFAFVEDGRGAAAAANAPFLVR